MLLVSVGILPVLARIVFYYSNPRTISGNEMTSGTLSNVKASFLWGVLTCGPHQYRISFHWLLMVSRIPSCQAQCHAGWDALQRKDNSTEYTAEGAHRSGAGRRDVWGA